MKRPPTLQQKYDKLYNEHREVNNNLEKLYNTRKNEKMNTDTNIQTMQTQLQSISNPSDLIQAYTNLQEDLKSVKTFLNMPDVTTLNIIPDKQFAPLVTLINIMNPNDQLDPIQISRHNKERSNNKNVIRPLMTNSSIPIL
jgi:ABC-type phosphate transport system auxiliary subunit